MNFLDKLERKYNKFAISNLMLYILYGSGFVLLLEYTLGARIVALTGSSLEGLLVFDINAILQGEVWRIISFVFIPNYYEIIWFLFSAFLYYYIGRELEATWGVFKFNLYYFFGVLLTMIASALFYGPGTTLYINLSLFLAYATLFPDVQFRIYFFIPVKVKYLAFIDIIYLLLRFIPGSLATKALIIVSLLNYLLFFGIPLLKNRPTQTQRQYRRQKREFKPGSNTPIHVAFHKCTACGKTELTHPDAEFRYCSKCSGNYEYCMDHIKEHEHVK